MLEQTCPVPKVGLQRVVKVLSLNSTKFVDIEYFSGGASRKHLSGMIPWPLLVFKVLWFFQGDSLGPRGCLLWVCGEEGLCQSKQEQRPPPWF